MPVLARKIIICAAVDGLILQPTHGSRDQRPIPPVRVRYGDGSISSVSRDGVPDISQPNSSFEAHGVVGQCSVSVCSRDFADLAAPCMSGLLTVFRYNYLVSITRRQQVAQIRGVPVYVVTEVALTPCSSQKDAGEAVASTALSLGKADADKTPDVDAATEADHDDTRSETGTIDSVVDYAPEPSGAADWPAALSQNSSRSSIAEDVIGRRGSYGRFAQRWFSKSGWALGQKRSMGLSPEKALADSGGDAGPANTAIPDGARITEDAAGSDAARNLLPKFLRTTQILFGSSRSFYFSYDHDLTRSLKNPQTPDTPLFPMHNHVDPEYFWNRNILQPFIDAGIDSLALPLMQGFVGQRTFVVDRHPPQEDDGPGKDSVEMADFARRASGAGSPPDQGTPDPGASEKRFNITVVSRRSTQRAGLRYLRRGVDDAGYAANNVETEQMLSPADATRDPAARVYSFTQVRGSIPLFFTQSPFSLKPAPVVQHSAEANFAAMSKHFERLRRRYGGLQVVNLVEKHGTEAQIGEQFEKNVDRINKAAQWEDDLVPFEWFDFHAACRGMKFENVSLLLQTLGSRLDGFGSTVVVHDKLAAQQSGVFRTNCMDCLDRTNVCQSSFAKFMLDAQLKEQGFEMGAQADQVNAWFNTLWADNGDAISRQYASTNAMKGDYTRTKKRDYRGALTDAGLSLTRLFNG